MGNDEIIPSDLIPSDLIRSDLIPIGRFARLCRLSVQRLRHYAELGLLVPARVDPATGYRFYTRDQMRDAMAISLLRGLEVPLPAIAEVLAGDEETRAKVLGAERARLAEELERRRRTLGALERLLADGLWRADVALVREPGRRLLTVEAVCTVDEIGPATSGCVARLIASGVPLDGPLWGVFPVDLDGPMRIAIGLESTGPDSGLVATHVPAGPAVTTTHLGPYEQLPLAYQAVFAWIHERGLGVAGHSYETYLTDPTVTAPDQLVTRLTVPIVEEFS